MHELVGPDDLSMRKSLFLDSQFREILDRPVQNHFVVVYDDWSLQQLRMIGHDMKKLVVSQVLSGNVFAISRLFHAKDVLRPQTGTAQERLQFAGRKRMLDVIDRFEFHTLFSQDTLDLAAGASGWLFVQRDLVFHRCPLRRSSFGAQARRTPTAGKMPPLRNPQNNFAVVLAFFQQLVALDGFVEGQDLSDLRSQFLFCNPTR